MFQFRYLLFLPFLIGTAALKWNPVITRSLLINLPNIATSCDRLEKHTIPEDSTSLQHFVAADRETKIIKILRDYSFLFFTVCTQSSPVFAVDGNYGILESIPAGMIHPIIFGFLYIFTLQAAWKGFQIRNLRDLNKESNKSLELQQRISSIKNSNPKDTHKNMGAILLGFGTALALEGGLSTYWRVGELFPGDHLFVGMGMVGVWALAYSLAPYMEKGQAWARNTHFGLGILSVVLFTWQFISGWEITTHVITGDPGW